MAENSFGMIGIEDLKEIITFDREELSGRNRSDDKETGNSAMYELQEEGAVYLWNKLYNENIAILADEVGMGKTLQALAVMCVLWKFKPDARVMILSPNQNVMEKWESEYRTFVEKHYKIKDHIIKDFNSNPIHLPKQYRNFEEATSEKSATETLTLAKISTFSYVDEDEKKEYPCKNYFGNYDLLIVDEAHYFRNKRGSKRASFAMEFFNDLAEKVLLLTATPNFKSANDIPTILSFFTSFKVEDQERIKKHLEGQKNGNDRDSDFPAELMEKFGLRRLRQINEKSKYHYRNEVQWDANFNDENSEIFYAMYQKYLAILSGASENKRTFQIGYLEGFEFDNKLELPQFISDQSYKENSELLKKFYEEEKNGQKMHHLKRKPDQETEDNSTNNEIKNEKNANDEIITILNQLKKSELKKDDGKDFHNHIDSKVLRELFLIYEKTINEGKDVPLSHPKYDKLITEILKVNESLKSNTALHFPVYEKSLVFVRRIASVYEITRRVNEWHDATFLNMLNAAFKPKNEVKEIPSREKFNEKFDFGFKDDDETDSDNEGKEESDDTRDNRISKTLNLFVTVEGEKKPPHPAKWRKRFTNSGSWFSVFFEPGLGENGETGYPYFNEFLQSSKKDAFRDTFRAYRYSQEESDELARSLFQNELKLRGEPNFSEKEETVPTLWTVFLNIACKGVKDAYKALGFIEREALARFVSAGVRLSSSALVELYCWYVAESNSQKEVKAKKAYDTLIKGVKDNLSGSYLFYLMKNSVLTFKEYCAQILRVSKKNMAGLLMNERSWGFFNNGQPAIACCGETKYTSAIRAFNTPFFPNVLAATSVLQEGVDLHFHCDTVIHYGLSHTAGQNEQRIGRADRLFGKLNRKLIEKDENAFLTSVYPYLAGSFDEIQLSVFLEKKVKAENLLDNCKNSEDPGYIDSDTVSSDWKNYLRKPIKEGSKTSLPVYPSTGLKIMKKEISFSTTDYINMEQFSQHIYHCAKEILGDKSICEKFQSGSLWGKYNNKIAFFNCENLNGKGRHQPFLIEANCISKEEWGLSESIFYLTLKSPLREELPEDKEDKIQECLNERNLLQICYDKDAEGFFKLYTRIDLVVIYEDSKLYLSKEELSIAINEIVIKTDEIEWKLFNKDDKAALQDGLSGKEQDIPTSKVNFKTVDGSDSQNAFENWEEEGGEYLCRREKLSQKKFNDIGERLKFNHEHPFVKISNEELLTVRPRAHVQEEELKQLTEFFKAVLERYKK